MLMLRLGVWLRNGFSGFRKFYIPASVIAGGLGWILIGLLKGIEGFVLGETIWVQRLSAPLSDWPGWLIAFVFAGLLLSSRESRSLRRSFSRVGREGIMVWVIVLGQTAVGLLVTGFVIQPFFDVPNSFGMLIETGFAGGHGTAAAMGQVFKHQSIGLDGGRDLGVVVATIGLVYGLATGMIWVNLGVRRGWLKTKGAMEIKVDSALNVSSSDATADSPDSSLPSKISATSKHPPVNPKLQLLNRPKSLLVCLAGLLVALLVGMAIQNSIIEFSRWWESLGHLEGHAIANEPAPEVADALSFLPVDNLSDQTRSSGQGAAAGQLIHTQPAARVKDEELTSGKGWVDARSELEQRLGLAAVVGSFPLFIFTLFGGWLVSRGLRILGKATVIEADLIQQITGIAMDVLVFAAIASLRLETVATFFGPLALLLFAGFVWTGFCLLYLSRHLLPSEHWFELGLMNYGMSTGTTATGFVLLRLVDPKLETGAAEDYALAAPLSSPFIGGGMLTIGLPLLVLEKLPISLVCSVLMMVVLGLAIFGWIWNRRVGWVES